MKVYLVEISVDYEGSATIGIFSTYKKAKQALVDKGWAKGKPYSETKGFIYWRCSSESATISTIELDKVL